MKKKFTIVLSLFMFVNLLIINTTKINAIALGDLESDLFKDEKSAVEVIDFSLDNNKNNNSINNGSVGKSRDIYLTDDDVYLMAQIVFAESRSEPFEGKVAVASVILNRVEQPGFPKSVKGVITQKNAFSCIKNGKISVIPDESSYQAVLQALKGKDPTNQAVFFYNPKIATSSWMINVSKKNIKTIGNHVFFKVK